MERMISTARAGGRVPSAPDWRSGPPQRGDAVYFVPMRQRAETVLQEALTLPEEERAEIAGVLLESLESAPDTEVETAWRQEVAARVAALEAGGVELRPWEEIRDRFLARL